MARQGSEAPDAEDASYCRIQSKRPRGRITELADGAILVAAPPLPLQSFPTLTGSTEATVINGGAQWTWEALEAWEAWELWSSALRPLQDYVTISPGLCVFGRHQHGLMASLMMEEIPFRERQCAKCADPRRLNNTPGKTQCTLLRHYYSYYSYYDDNC